MGRLRQTAGKKELLRLQMRRAHPSRDCIARLLGDLKLHRPLRLLLHDDRAGGDMTALDHIMDAKSDQIAPAQLAVNGEVEQCKFSGSMIQLQSNPDGPDLFQFQWRLLTKQLALIPRTSTSVRCRCRVHELLLCCVKGALCSSQASDDSRPNAELAVDLHPNFLVQAPTDWPIIGR